MKSNICIYKNRGIATKPQLPKLQLQTDMLTFLRTSGRTNILYQSFGVHRVLHTMSNLKGILAGPEL